MMENFHVLGLLPCQKPAMENWPKETKKEGSHINRLSLSLKESKEKYYHMLCSSWISTDGTYLLLCNWRKNGFYSILTWGLQFLHTFCVIHAGTLILLNLLYFLCITNSLLHNVLHSPERDSRMLWGHLLEANTTLHSFYSGCLQRFLLQDFHAWWKPLSTFPWLSFSKQSHLRPFGASSWLLALLSEHAELIRDERVECFLLFYFFMRK